MSYALTQTGAPTEEPVTRAEAILHLKQDVSDEDSLIDLYLVAAREYCERETGRQFVAATYTVKYDRFPQVIRLPKPPLASATSVTSVAYVDTSGDPQTLTVTTEYTVDSSSLFARIVPAYGTSWPSTRDQPNAVTVTYVAGYGAASAVPYVAKAAILLIVGDLYTHRSAGTELRVARNPTVDALLATISVKEAA